MKAYGPVPAGKIRKMVGRWKQESYPMAWFSRFQPELRVSRHRMWSLYSCFHLHTIFGSFLTGIGVRTYCPGMKLFIYLSFEISFHVVWMLVKSKLKQPIGPLNINYQLILLKLVIHRLNGYYEHLVWDVSFSFM